MKYISPRIQVGYVFQHTLVPQCMDAYADDGNCTSLSASCSNDALVSPFQRNRMPTIEIHQPAGFRTFSLTVSLSGLTLDSLKPVEQMMCKTSGLRQAQDPLV